MHSICYQFSLNITCLGNTSQKILSTSFSMIPVNSCFEADKWRLVCFWNLVVYPNVQSLFEFMSPEISTLTWPDLPPTCSHHPFLQRTSLRFGFTFTYSSWIFTAKFIPLLCCAFLSSFIHWKILTEHVFIY